MWMMATHADASVGQCHGRCVCQAGHSDSLAERGLEAGSQHPSAPGKPSGRQRLGMESLLGGG